MFFNFEKKPIFKALLGFFLRRVGFANGHCQNQFLAHRTPHNFFLVFILKSYTNTFSSGHLSLLWPVSSWTELVTSISKLGLEEKNIFCHDLPWLKCAIYHKIQIPSCFLMAHIEDKCQNLTLGTWQLWWPKQYYL